MKTKKDNAFEEKIGLYGGLYGARYGRLYG